MPRWHFVYILQDTFEAGWDFQGVHKSVSGEEQWPRESVVCCGSIQSQGPEHVATYTTSVHQVGTDGVVVFHELLCSKVAWTALTIWSRFPLLLLIAFP